MIQYLAHVRYDKFIVWTECACLAVVLGTYMYFITSSVVEAVLHNSIAYEIERTEQLVNNLESSYFKHLDALTPASLEEYNLVAAAPLGYVHVSESEGRLTKRD